MVIVSIQMGNANNLSSVKKNKSPKVVRTKSPSAKVAKSPKTSKSIKATKSPKVAKSPKINKSPKVAKSVKASKSPKIAKSTRVNKSPKASKPAKVNKSTKKFDIMSKIGILDPEGKEVNPLTGEPYQNMYSDEMFKNTDIPMTYKSLAKEKWTILPVYQKKEEIIKAMDKHQVLLGISGTGSGKSVLLPKFALHISNYEKKVLCCIPTKVSVKRAAEFAARCMDVQLGQEVGYFYKGDKKISDKTMLTFTTTGSLFSRITNGEINEYGTIIMDEVHQDSVDSILCLLLLKNAIQKNKDLKLVLMSATVNEQKYRDYFPAPDFDYFSINVGSGTTYQIDSIYLPKPIGPREVQDKIVETIINILNNGKDGDILAFVKSGPDGRKVCGALMPKCKKLGYNVFCTELESRSDSNKHPDTGVSKKNYALEADLYKSHPNVNKDNPPDRKIVISTNVAESSVTVDGVVYVIESGYELLDKYYPDKMARSLKDEYIAKSAVTQRKGRAGRTQPGVCYHLYTQEQFNDFNDYPIPDMQKTDLSDKMMDLLRSDDINNIGELRNFMKKLIDPPEENFIISGLMILYALDAITSIDNDGVLTPLGVALASFRGIKLMHSRSILSAYFNHCKNEVIDIVALIILIDGNIENLFKRYDEKKSSVSESEFKKNQKSFYHKYGDHLSFLNVIKAYRDLMEKKEAGEMTEGEIKKWCFNHGIGYNLFQKGRHKRQAQELNRYVSQLRPPRMNRTNNKSIKPLSIKMDNINIKPLNINMGSYNVQQSAGSIDELAEYIPFNNSLSSLDDKILKSFLDGCFINIGLQKGKNRYSTCFPPQKTTTTVNKGCTLSTFGKICIYDELFIASFGEKFNIVSKFPNSIINNLNENLKDTLKSCESAKNNTQNHHKRKNSKHQKRSKKGKKRKKSFGRFKKGRR